MLELLRKLLINNEIAKSMLIILYREDMYLLYINLNLNLNGEIRMLLEPEYAQNIIVSVVFQGEWQWYVTDRDLWFLDLNKLREAFAKKGYYTMNTNDDSERFGIKVLNEKTAKIFLKNIHEYRVETNDLRKKIVEDYLFFEDPNYILDMCPALMVDFDKKILISLFPEPASYEYYVPDGWMGKYEDFTVMIPDEQKYWIINGEDFFKKFSNLK